MCVCSPHVCVCVYYAYVCVLCIYVCACVCAVCVPLPAVCCGMCVSQHAAPRSTLHVSQCHVVAHTHTHISMQTCCGFCVRVCVCVRVWQIWSICSLRCWHFAFLTFAFFVTFAFVLSLTRHISPSLSLYPCLSPLSTRGTYNFVMKFAAHGQQFMCCCNYSLGLRRSSPGQ